jgi:hypothetical protein
MDLPFEASADGTTKRAKDAKEEMTVRVHCGSQALANEWLQSFNSHAAATRLEV